MKRKDTNEGKDYNGYTYLGGDLKSSLPKSERAKIIEHMTDAKLTRLLLSGADTKATDALMYLGIGLQPDLSLRSVSVCPNMLRNQCRVGWVFWGEGAGRTKATGGRMVHGVRAEGGGGRIGPRWGEGRGRRRGRARAGKQHTSMARAVCIPRARWSTSVACSSVW